MPLAHVRRHPGASLDAYLDGELDPPEAHRIGGHLEGCPECTRHASLTRLVQRSLRRMLERPAEPRPPD